jgi:hypothetical protein
VRGAPLVSVLVVCKDSARTIRRCIESLLAQEHPRVQIVVQDGVSTDGTLDILRAYGDRIDLVSEPDRDQNDAFVRGLRRCRGDVIGFCWADEELLPHAARRGAELLGARPELGAVYGNFIETDLEGVGDAEVSYPEWSFERVFAYEFIPPFCAAFFRREAIQATFLRCHELAPDCTEYMLWASVGARYPVAYVPEALARYARHPDQLSMRPERVSAYPAKIVDAIRGLLADPAMPERARELEDRACAHVHLWAAQALLDGHGDASDWKLHLERALDFGPAPLRLTLFHFESLKRFLREGRPDRMFDLLEVVRVRGISSAGLVFARSLALFAADRREEAAALEPHVRTEPGLDELLELVENLVEGLFRSGVVEPAEHALGIFWRLGDTDPDFLYRLAILLGRLGRYDHAIVAARKHLELVPGHRATLGLVDQLGLAFCLGSPKLRAELSDLVGKEVRDAAEGFPFAHAVWRCLLDPAATERLAGPQRESMRMLVAPFGRAARQVGLAELGAKLADVERALAHQAGGRAA